MANKSPCLPHKPVWRVRMELIDRILKWSETDLKLWQQDAVRRLFQQENQLSEHDWGELYILLKAANGLPDPLNLKPLPLKAAHLPVVSKADETVILTSMRNLTNVNCISPTQKLVFEPSGMTLIYGENGSGKSGYTRVMKKACRARHQENKIHPNVNDPGYQYCVPEATFDIKINEKSKSIKWTADNDSPDELATITVFDSHCARIYLTSEQDVSYLPYGLDVVEYLANKVLPTLNDLIDKEISKINTDSKSFAHLLGETKVGQLISTLNHTTAPEKVKILGTLSDQELDRIEKLEKALAEADPTSRANELKLSADRMMELEKRIEFILNWINDAAIKKLKGYYDSNDAAIQTEKQAALALQSGEMLLPGTGEQIWKELFHSARKYSTEVAYRNHPFPYTDDEAVCPLCQQPLKEGAERIKRFEEYIQNDVAKTALQRRQEVESEKAKIRVADLAIGLNESLKKELTPLDEAIIPILTIFQKKVDIRRTWMLESLNTQGMETAPDLGENPLQRLREIRARQLNSAHTLVDLADRNLACKLKSEYEELCSRKKLSLCLSSVLSLIEKMRQKQLLELCKKDLKTKPISDKSKEFSKFAVTEALKNALNDEFKALGIGHIKIQLKDRNEKGKIKHQIILDLPSKQKIDEILSEGEQRAIALGSFLAELKIANHSGGIVLDDPVSSLDHKHREYVAKRLAIESKQRQVIIFTHDLIFLHDLKNEYKNLNSALRIFNLQKFGDFCGCIYDGLPWDGKDYVERIKNLKNELKDLERSLPTDSTDMQNLKIGHQYSHLRATIERVVQDVVLKGTVQRFNRYVRVKKLEMIVGLKQTEVDEILRLFDRCNDWTDAHDNPSFQNATSPTLENLKQDIDDLERVIEKIKTRQNSKKKPTSGTYQ